MQHRIALLYVSMSMIFCLVMRGRPGSTSDHACQRISAYQFRCPDTYTWKHHMWCLQPHFVKTGPAIRPHGRDRDGLDRWVEGRAAYQVHITKLVPVITWDKNAPAPAWIQCIVTVLWLLSKPSFATFPVSCVLCCPFSKQIKQTQSPQQSIPGDLQGTSGYRWTKEAFKFWPCLSEKLFI